MKIKCIKNVWMGTSGPIAFTKGKEYEIVSTNCAIDDQNINHGVMGISGTKDPWFQKHFRKINCRSTHNKRFKLTPAPQFGSLCFLAYTICNDCANNEDSGEDSQCMSCKVSPTKYVPLKTKHSAGAA